ncbi:hypothetical protein C7S17_6450 [Burkholderia thailandensis]|nr:hypothetical protein [Burkholderia thailandensis]
MPGVFLSRRLPYRREARRVARVAPVHHEVNRGYFAIQCFPGIRVSEKTYLDMRREMKKRRAQFVGLSMRRVRAILFRNRLKSACEPRAKGARRDGRLFEAHALTRCAARAAECVSRAARAHIFARRHAALPMRRRS